VIVEDELVTIGWISDDYKMIRSPYGAVWVQLSPDMPAAERAEAFDEHEDQALSVPAEEASEVDRPVTEELQ
jgi:hypothetical protein